MPGRRRCSERSPPARRTPRDAGVALADGQLWIANLGGSVGVVDLATGQLIARAAIGEGEPAAVVIDDRWAWVPTHGPGGGLTRLDRADPQRDPLILALPESAFAAARGDGTVWVAGLERRVFAVDAATGSVVRTIDAGAAPRGIAVAAGDVWVSLRDERAVIRIDPATGEETARIDTGGQPWPIAADRERVWVATLDGGLMRIDTSTNAVTARATVGLDARGVAVTEDTVWVASQSGSVSRVTNEASTTTCCRSMASWRRQADPVVVPPFSQVFPMMVASTASRIGIP